MIRKLRNYSKSIFIVCFLLASLISSAQIDELVPPDPCTDPDLPCPIDGGVSFLIAAAIGIGAKKAYSLKNNGSTAPL